MKLRQAKKIFRSYCTEHRALTWARAWQRIEKLTGTGDICEASKHIGNSAKQRKRFVSMLDRKTKRSRIWTTITLDEVF